MKPLLSVGIIFRNEIRCLERCLKALQPLRDAVPCEVIMADTGAEDGSRQVAEQYADQVFDFPWIDDFAAARNAVMDRCGGAWYLSLDADEVLDSDVTELVQFLHSPAAEQAQLSYLTIHNYTDAHDLSKYVSFQALRLVNLSTGARFSGKIHEKIPMTKGTAVCSLAHTQLWHDGYLKQDGKSRDQKKLRNLPMIQQALEQDPQDPVLLMQALESAYTREQAAEYARRIMELVHSGENRRPALEPILYRDAVKAACVHGLPEYAQWIDEAVERFPDSPYVSIDIRYYGTSMALRTGDWAGMGTHSGVYLEAVERFNSGDGYDLNMGAIWSATRDYVETVSLIRGTWLAHQEDWAACQSILEAHPLKTVEPQNVMLWFGLVFNNLDRMELTEVFRQVGRDFLGQPALEPRDQEKWKLFVNGCRQLFAREFEDTPFHLVEALGECELGYWARIMRAGDPAQVQAAAEKIRIWKAVPPLVLKKIADLKLPLPKAYYEQMPKGEAGQ